MIAVLGVDPGGTTGLAVVRWDPLTLRFTVVADQFTDPVAAMGWIKMATYRSRTVRAVAAERFVVSRRAGRSKGSRAAQTAREMLGALDSAGLPVPVVRHTAAAVKAWATHARLEAAGLTAALSGQQHARDAARHALFTLVEHRWAPDPLSLVTCNSATGEHVMPHRGCILR